MPNYLAVASYTPEGLKALLKTGGTARRAAVEKMLESLDGHLKAFYFAFGENDAYLIVELPNNLAAAAISLAVAAAGGPHQDYRTAYPRRDGRGRRTQGQARTDEAACPQNQTTIRWCPPETSVTDRPCLPARARGL